MAKHLDQEPGGFDISLNMESTQRETIIDVAPQPSSMEVDTQSNLDNLVSKNPAMSEVEHTLNRIRRDGHNILAEFVDW